MLVMASETVMVLIWGAFSARNHEYSVQESSIERSCKAAKDRVARGVLN